MKSEKQNTTSSYGLSITDVIIRLKSLKKWDCSTGDSGPFAGQIDWEEDEKYGQWIRLDDIEELIKSLEASNTTEKQTYNLTIGQKIQLPLLWLYWKLSQIENKKTWHQVKKGMEKHECVYTRKFKEHDAWWLGCEHEGCTNCIYDEERNN